MAYLVDTGILLRLIDKDDALSDVVEAVVLQLVKSNERLFASTQNFAELWNVSTRSLKENGLGLSTSDVLNRIEHTLEPLVGVLREHRRHYAVLKRLLSTYDVRGKQVHDARLVATMLTWRVESVLTLNTKHFQRFTAEGIRMVAPQNV